MRTIRKNRIRVFFQGSIIRCHTSTESFFFVTVDGCIFFSRTKNTQPSTATKKKDSVIVYMPLKDKPTLLKMENDKSKRKRISVNHYTVFGEITFIQFDSPLQKNEQKKQKNSKNIISEKALISFPS